MSHVETSERELAEAKRSLETCQNQIDGLVLDLRTAVVSAAPEHEVDELQASRNTLLAKRERLELHRQALEERIPEAAKADAQKRLPGLVKRLKTQAKGLAEAYANFSVAIDVLEKAVSDIEAVQGEAKDFNLRNLRIEALCTTHGLPVPSIPELPKFPYGEASRAWARESRVKIWRGFSPFPRQTSRASGPFLP